MLVLKFVFSQDLSERIAVIRDWEKGGIGCSYVMGSEFQFCKRKGILEVVSW